MRVECIELLTEGNREIEFNYNGKRYSVTYFSKNGEDMISFCEFYKMPTNVKTVNELLAIKIDGLTLEEVFSKLPDDAFDIF